MSTGPVSSVDIRQLEALRAVVEHGTFGRAADALGYTQSAVSQQIGSLERATGVSLFTRRTGPRPPKLTEAGRLLNEHGVAVLERLHLATADLDQFRAGERGRVAIGTFQSISVAILPDLIAAMHTRHPGIDVTLFESDEQPELVDGLIGGDLDLSFAVEPLEHPGIRCMPLLDDRWVVLTRADELPAVNRRKEVPLSWLHNRPLIGQTSSHCQLLVENHLRREGVETNVVFRTADNKAVANMVRSGMGVAVMPLLAVDPTEDVLVTPLDSLIPPRRLVLAQVADRAPSAAVANFVALIEEFRSLARSA
jgi:DNA-binding transcriptional LysR family regulator